MLCSEEPVNLINPSGNQEEKWSVERGQAGKTELMLDD